MQLIQRLAIKVITASLLINSWTVISTESVSAKPCTKDWFSKHIGCKIDPSNGKSAGGKVVSKVVPVQCAGTAAVGSFYITGDPSTAVKSAVAAHKVCYKTIKYIQNR